MNTKKHPLQTFLEECGHAFEIHEHDGHLAISGKSTQEMVSALVTNFMWGGEEVDESDKSAIERALRFMKWDSTSGRAVIYFSTCKYVDEYK